MKYEVEFFETTRHVYEVNNVKNKEDAEAKAESVYYSGEEDEDVKFCYKKNTENSIGMTREIKWTLKGCSVLQE